MSSDPPLNGWLLRVDTPEWGPLERLIGFELADFFMWMGTVRLEDGRDVQTYKHRTTRRYFHLASDGAAFLYVSGRYQRITGVDAIEVAFSGWDRLLPHPDDPDATRAALNEALARAGA